MGKKKTDESSAFSNPVAAQLDYFWNTLSFALPPLVR